MNITDEIYSDLLEEVGKKNFVRVTHYKAIEKKNSVTIHKKIMDEISDGSSAQLPALFLHDSLRVLSGKAPIYIPELTSRMGGEFVSLTPNLRVNVGTDFCATQLSSTSPTTQADYIALSNNTNAPTATDTSATLPWSTANATDGTPAGTRGEYTALGLARKQATYAHTTGVASYTLAATWTATSAITSVTLAGLFGGAARTAQGSGGTNILFLENTFTATTLANGDQLSLTWTVNI